jgi:hypothetical protein
MKHILISVITLLLAGLLPAQRSIAQNLLSLPPIENTAPGPGKRVPVTPSEYQGTKVHHVIYLPTDWNPDWKAKGQSWPVIVEYTGNYFPQAGSTGRVEDAALGFGISGGRFIWAVLPYISADHTHNEVTWWGDELATVDYAKTNVPRICEKFGGDPSAVFICGFSRGAIGVNYIGLHDDEIARLWCGFISHDHYDGVREWKGTTWGAPLDAYRKAALARLSRLQGRPVLVCSNGGTPGIAKYLEGLVPLQSFTFVNVQISSIFPEFPNQLAIHPHTDRWLLKDSRDRRRVWDWVDQVLRTRSASPTKVTTKPDHTSTPATEPPSP